MSQIANRKKGALSGAFLLTSVAGVAAFILVGAATPAVASTPGDGWTIDEFLDAGFQTAFDYKPRWDSSLVPENSGSALALISCGTDRRAWIEPARLIDDGISKPVYVNGPDVTRPRDDSAPAAFEIALLVVTPQSTSSVWSSGCLSADTTTTEQLKAWYEANETLSPTSPLAPGATPRVDPTYPQLGMDVFDPYDAVRPATPAAADLVTPAGARVVVRPGDSFGDLDADEVAALVAAAVGDGATPAGADLVPAADLPGSGVYVLDAGEVLFQPFDGAAPYPVSVAGGRPVVPAAPVSGSESDPTTPATGDGTTTVPATSDTGGRSDDGNWSPPWWTYLLAAAALVVVWVRSAGLARRIGYPLAETVLIAGSVWLLSRSIFAAVVAGVATSVGSPQRLGIGTSIAGTANSQNLAYGHSSTVRYAAAVVLALFGGTLLSTGEYPSAAVVTYGAVLGLHLVSTAGLVANRTVRGVGDRWVAAWSSHRDGYATLSNIGSVIGQMIRSTGMRITLMWFAVGATTVTVGAPVSTSLILLGVVWLLVGLPITLLIWSRRRTDPTETVQMPPDAWQVATAIASFTPVEKKSVVERGLSGNPVERQQDPVDVVWDDLRVRRDGTLSYTLAMYPINGDALVAKLAAALPGRIVELVDGRTIVFHPMTAEEAARRQMEAESSGVLTGTVDEPSTPLPPPTGQPSTDAPVVNLDWDD